MAEQFNFIKGPSFLVLLKCIAPAINSFPVPDSPVIRTVASDGATCATTSRSFTMESLRPIMF